MVWWVSVQMSFFNAKNDKKREKKRQQMLKLANESLNFAHILLKDSNAEITFCASRVWHRHVIVKSFCAVLLSIRFTGILRAIKVVSFCASFKLKKFQKSSLWTVGSRFDEMHLEGKKKWRSGFHLASPGLCATAWKLKVSKVSALIVK